MVVSWKELAPNTSGQQSRAHHYVPQWYQRRFLLPGQSSYHYLDLNPDTVVRDGISHRRNDLLHWSPARFFYKDDLYTLRFGPATTDVMEKFFFGMVDRLGPVPQVRPSLGLTWAEKDSRRPAADFQLTISCRPLRLDFYDAHFPEGVMTKAAPLPIPWFLHQSALHGFRCKYRSFTPNSPVLRTLRS
jgi:hypothetical protein